jgi:hypothetical protein
VGKLILAIKRSPKPKEDIKSIFFLPNLSPRTPIIIPIIAEPIISIEVIWPIKSLPKPISLKKRLNTTLYIAHETLLIKE